MANTLQGVGIQQDEVSDLPGNYRSVALRIHLIPHLKDEYRCSMLHPKWDVPVHHDAEEDR